MLRLPFSTTGWPTTSALVALVVFALLPACTPRPGYYGRTTPDPGRWLPVTGVAGFDVRMPAQPALEVGSEMADDGASMEVVTGSLATRDMIFGFRVTTDTAGFTGHPMSGGALVDFAGQPETGATAADAAWAVRSETEIAYRGFAGQDGVTVDAAANLVAYVRVLIGKFRVYVLIAVMSAYDETRLGHYARTYFDTVALDPADAPSPVGDGNLDFAAWRYIYPPEGGFAVSMPGAARRNEASFTDAEGTYPVNNYVVGQGAHSYQIFEIRVGHAPKEAMIDALRDRIAGENLSVQSERDAQRQGFASRVIVFSGPDRVVESHFVLTAGRLYEARVTTPTGQAAQSSAFFDSFRVL